MQTLSGSIKIFCMAISVFATITTCAEDALLLFRHDNTQVALKIKNHHLVAEELSKHSNYKVSSKVSRHLTRAYDVHIITNKNRPNGPLFIVLSREPSRPNALGRGYCGAGYEEYLLLIEVTNSKIELHDQLLLQSCLKSISMFIDHGDDLADAKNGLIPNSDGSFSYHLVDDAADQERNLRVDARRFKVKLLPSKTQQ